ncbi:DNA adenine methylase [Sphingomonas sp.]|uniref:DNA adenine methylase n=1 Tax=Sphingomonas sp. TaxID=28214 RepID=UPI0031D37127
MSTSLTMSTNAKFGRRSKDRHGAGVTPFRYPGGKAFLADALEERIRQLPVAIDTYAEAYAGGAGAAIELLARGAVQRVVLNDFDRRVFAAWWAILNHTEEFIDRIKSTPVTLDNWWACRALVEENDAEADRFELGFATYFLNRTNRSGVIIGAGPIGGYNQTGKWLIDARWYAETMTRRVRWLGERRDSIELHNADGLQFLRGFDTDQAQSTFFFIDPPYVVAGKKLYFDAMSDLKHRDLAHFLTTPGAVPHWLVTYDDCQLITDAYRTASIERLPVKYSLHRKRTEYEVCVVPAQAA